MRLIDWILKSDPKSLFKLSLNRVDVDSERPMKVTGQGIKIHFIPFNEYGSRDGDELLMPFTPEQVWAMDLYLEKTDSEPIMIKVTKKWVDVWFACPSPLLGIYEDLYDNMIKKFEAEFQLC